MKRFAYQPIIAGVLLLDQTTKRIVRATLADFMPRHYAGHVLTLVYTENAGAFLSLGDKLPPHLRTIIFDVVVAIGLLAALYVLFRGKVTAHGDDLALAFIIGGGVGNLIDRILFNGRVPASLYMQADTPRTRDFYLAHIG